MPYCNWVFFFNNQFIHSTCCILFLSLNLFCYNIISSIHRWEQIALFKCCVISKLHQELWASWGSMSGTMQREKLFQDFENLCFFAMSFWHKKDLTLQLIIQTNIAAVKFSWRAQIGSLVRGNMRRVVLLPKQCQTMLQMGNLRMRRESMPFVTWVGFPLEVKLVMRIYTRGIFLWRATFCFVPSFLLLIITFFNSLKDFYGASHSLFSAGEIL